MRPCPLKANMQHPLSSGQACKNCAGSIFFSLSELLHGRRQLLIIVLRTPNVYNTLSLKNLNFFARFTKAPNFKVSVSLNE